MLFARRESSNLECVPLDMLKLKGKLLEREGDVEVFCSSMRTISNLYIFMKGSEPFVEFEDQYLTKDDIYIDVAVMFWKDTDEKPQGIMVQYHDIEPLIRARVDIKNRMVDTVVK